MADEVISNEQIEKFQRDGYAVVEDFLSDSEIEALKAECHQLVEDMNPEEHSTVFSAVRQSHRDDYFMNSCDRIGFFYEDGALDANGKLTVDKHVSLNKIGHALHLLCPASRAAVFNERVKGILKKLSFDDPVIVQSMFIFKPPRLGGVVLPHQDASYLFTEPTMRLAGLWVALDDATLENGCLSFIPGSHKSGVHNNYRMVRNPNADGPRCTFTGERATYKDDEFVPAPVKRGSLVLLDGLVVHKSAHNHSDKPRLIFTFHIYDAKHATWSPDNWVQPTPVGAFQHLYDF